jgi:hypothetical protein
MPSAILLASLLSLSAIDQAPALTDPAPAAWTATDSAELFSPETIFYEPASPAAISIDFSRSNGETSLGYRVTSLDTSLIRGQNYDEDPSGGNLGQPTFAAPPIGMPFAQQGTIWPGTPLLAPNGMLGGPAPAATMQGINGPQPYRFGWTAKFDVGFLPEDFLRRPAIQPPTVGWSE